MKKLNFFLATVAATFCLQSAQAQCASGRYKDMLFTGVTKTTVVYSSVYNDTMDVYVPTGDTLAKRPLMIFAHGGSFYGGDRNEATIVTLCNNFAKRGYVTASINYRLETNVGNMLNYNGAVTEVMKAISDAKACVRWFRQDAATTNTYKIDPTRIIFGGNSAGAVIAVHMGYMDILSEAPANMQPIITANGGIDGNSGNPGYSSSIYGVFNMAGAIHDTSMINAGEVPMISFQGDSDNIVPYHCAYPLGGAVPVTLCGLGSMQPRITRMGLYNKGVVFPGDGHVPWSTDAAKLVKVDTLARNFFYDLICTNVGINDVKENVANIRCMPNPTSSNLQISSLENLPISSVQLVDEIGRVVFQQSMNQTKFDLNVKEFTKGVYFLNISTDENHGIAHQRILIN